jgi:biotin operon repressor
MGRHIKVTAQEVLETLDNTVEQLTADQLGEIFGVHSITIRSRIKELRMDGEAIIHNKNGFLKINKENLKEEDVANIMESFSNWILSVLKGAFICAHPTKPLLPTMKKTLRLTMSTSERKLLASSCVKLKALCDYVQAEEDFDNE